MLKLFLKKYWKTLLCAIGIAFMSLYTFQPIDMPRVVHVDKMIHVAMYMVLTVVLFWDLRSRCSTWQAWCVLILLPSLYGGLMEILQAYCTTTRTGDWFDWMADTLGSWAVVLVCWGYYKLRH